MRVGLFTNNYLPMLGGVARAVETVRTALVGLGHRPFVVAPRMPGAAGSTDVLRVAAVPAPTYPDFALPLPVTAAVVRRIEALDLDVFHAQHPFLLGVTARRLARRLGRPLVFTYHTLYDKYAHYVPLPRPLVARQAVAWSIAFANSADLVIAPSAGLASRLRGQGVRRPVVVLPTGVDLDAFRPGDREAARRALGLPPAAPLCLYVGRLDREKNLEFLLDAFALVAARQPAARLVVVGRGTRESRLRRHAARLPAGDRILFAGGVAPDVAPRYFQAADVFLFASTTETQGLAVLEAMAAGRPVVAVRASGVEEAVVDGVTGLLVAEDLDVFAAAVIQVLADGGLAGKLSAGGREAALAFGARALGARLAALYGTLRAGQAAA